MQDLFGRDIEQVAIERIRTFCPEEGYYVAFSGGKDSVVIYDLVKRSGVKADYHYNITGIDPPELVRFIKTFHDVQRHKPEKTMWQLIPEKRLPPTRLVRYCCEYLKERGGIDRRVITGIRWAESSRRGKRKMAEACFRHSRKFYIHPIIDWSNKDVWDYIYKHKLQYCSLYDEGFKRLGCIMCPFAPQEFDMWRSRYPRFYSLYIKALDRCVIKRIEDGLPTTWKNGEELYAWWKRQKSHGNPDQTVMFE